MRLSTWIAYESNPIRRLAQGFNCVGKNTSQKPLIPLSLTPTFSKNMYIFNRAIGTKSASFSSLAKHRELHDPPRFQDTEENQTLALIARSITHCSVCYLNRVFDGVLTGAEHVAMNCRRQMRVVLIAFTQRELRIRLSFAATRNKTAP